MANEQVLRTPDQWLAESQYRGIVVMDPDGWDRKNFEQSWSEPISEAEFSARMMMSTCRFNQQSPMTIAKTTRPHLLTREAAAARIETLEAALRHCIEELEDMHGTKAVLTVARAALNPTPTVSRSQAR